MILGMSLATFVLVHVVISLIAIVAGIIVMFGMLGSKPQPGLTAIFLLFTILTSATGFPDSAAGVRKAAAVAHGRRSLAGAAGDRLHRALRHEAGRRLALDLCADRAGLALPQRVRAGDPEVPQSAGAACAGAGQSRRPGRRSPSSRASCWCSSSIVIIGAWRRFRPVPTSPDWFVFRRDPKLDQPL